jgi:hypothetical protein
MSAQEKTSMVVTTAQGSAATTAAPIKVQVGLVLMANLFSALIAPVLVKTTTVVATVAGVLVDLIDHLLAQTAHVTILIVLLATVLLSANLTVTAQVVEIALVSVVVIVLLATVLLSANLMVTAQVVTALSVVLTETVLTLRMIVVTAQLFARSIGPKTTMMAIAQDVVTWVSPVLMSASGSRNCALARPRVTRLVLMWARSVRCQTIAKSYQKWSSSMLLARLSRLVLRLVPTNLYA